MTALGAAMCTGRAQESAGPPVASGAAQWQAVLMEAGVCGLLSPGSCRAVSSVVACSEPSAVLVPAENLSETLQGERRFAPGASTATPPSKRTLEAALRSAGRLVHLGKFVLSYGWACRGRGQLNDKMVARKYSFSAHGPRTALWFLPWHQVGEPLERTAKKWVQIV